MDFSSKRHLGFRYFLLLILALGIMIPWPVLAAFNDINASLPDVYNGSVAWGDYDNDGDLDILITGSDSSSNAVSKIFRNSGGVFAEDTSISLTAVSSGSVAWGDYDNDGDLDILLTGYAGSSGATSKIYRNDVGVFAEDTSISLTEVYNSSVAWGDYDNDGDLDILLTGGDSYDNPDSKIYRNDGGAPGSWVFTEDTSISLLEAYMSSVAWGDYDGDGDLDILLTGRDSAGYLFSEIYRNDGGVPGSWVFTEDTSISLAGVDKGSVAWGDYDNDGDLDILFTGYDLDSSASISKIYRNDGAGSIPGNWVFEEDTTISLAGVMDSSVAWGDYDNDGDLDILLTGRVLPNSMVSIIYRNDGGTINNWTFTEDTSISLPGVHRSSVAWGDYDNDGDLDILLTGSDSSGDPVSKLYRNDGGGVDFNFNTRPTAPADLDVTHNGATTVLSWGAGADPETPADGLSYNIRVGTATDGVEVVSPMANSNGWRMIAALGKAGARQFAHLKDLAVDTTYYWNVQALDTSLAGSEWSLQGSFTLRALTVGVFGAGSGKVTSNPAGIDCGSDCSKTVLEGADVTLTATAAAGSNFIGWYGGGCTGTGSCTVTLDESKYVIAVFEPTPTYTLTVDQYGTGSGTVTSDPAGIGCGSDCSEAFVGSAVVTLTAAADQDSAFTGWSGGGCSGTDPCEVTMTSAKNVTANFQAAPTYTLTVDKFGTGSGTVTSDPAGIDCGGDCTEDLSEGDVLTLTATAAPDNTFNGWSGGVCSGTGPCTVTMDASKNVTANFTSASSFSLDVTRSGTGSGTIASVPAGIDCGTVCQSDFIENTLVTLSAIPESGSSFSGWSLAACPGNDDCRLTLVEDTSVTAVFDADNDSDGIGTVIEDAGPNNGDGNQDGIPDSEQGQVATFQDITGDYVTLVTESGVLSDVHATAYPGTTDFPENMVFPSGFYGFTITGLEPGASTQVTLLLHQKDVSLTTYYRYGPTSGNTADHWYEFLQGAAGVGATIIQEDDVTKILLDLTDGQTGDDDLTANGVIVEPGGPGADDISQGGSGSGGSACFLNTLQEGRD